jgi:ActR/RegA family two-component response regulator
MVIITAMKTAVLILDDDQCLLEVMSEFINVFCGRAVVTATRLVELKGLAAEVMTCELAFLDINLGPGLPNGLDAYKWLLEKGFKMRTFFITGHAKSHPLVVEAARLGDVQILAKPIDRNQLVKIIGAR